MQTAVSGMGDRVRV